MPASTVSANAPVRLSIRRRVAIAAVMLVLLAGSTAAAWVNTHLVTDPADRATVIDIGGLRLALHPSWVVADGATPDPLADLGAVETFVDPDDPERRLTLASVRSDAPPANLVVAIFQALLSDRSEDEGTISVERPTPVTLDLVANLRGFALIGNSISNDAQAVTHHYVAVVYSPDDDRRWVICLEDRSPPGEPMSNRRETANNYIVGQLISTARPAP
ncbi:MAG: hypothetical protein AAGB29_09500 [Planctomycetota bacterium]